MNGQLDKQSEAQERVWAIRIKVGIIGIKMVCISRTLDEIQHRVSLGWGEKSS